MTQEPSSDIFLLLFYLIPLLLLLFLCCAVVTLFIPKTPSVLIQKDLRFLPRAGLRGKILAL
jgi:hypothetical protein